MIMIPSDEDNQAFFKILWCHIPKARSYDRAF
jgi:hypothetical protein